MGKLDELGGVLEVRLEVLLVGAVIHDGGEASLDGLEAVLVGAVIEVKGNRHGDVEGVHHVDDDVVAQLEAGHPLGGASGALDDERALELLGSREDAVGPLDVVRVERAEAVVALLGRLEHVRSVNEHVLPP